MLMSDGLLYEPRSFWSIGTFGSTEDLTTSSTINLNRQHFYNGERWPVQINRIVTAGINYTFVNPPGPNPVFLNGSAAVNKVRVRVTAPQRYHYSTRRSFELDAVGPLPRWTPAPKSTNIIVEGSPVTFKPSSLWGECALKFDNPLYIPRTAALEWDISAYTPWASGGGTPVPQPLNSVPVCHQLYEEPGGLFVGDARTRSFRMRAYNQPTSVQQEGWPFLRDMFQPVVAAQPLETPDWWHPDGRFNVRLFDQQEATRAGSTSITAMRTMIDQTLYDAFIVQEGLASSVPRACPLSMRVGTRVRLANAGSNTWWWRPGAPLCLVFDQITPASVYQLHEPITIGPGDTLDVQMEFPPSSPAGLFTPQFQFGISFNGFAAIEG
jgi:hypothetical protein